MVAVEAPPLIELGSTNSSHSSSSSAICAGVRSSPVATALKESEVRWSLVPAPGKSLLPPDVDVMLVALERLARPLVILVALASADSPDVRGRAEAFLSEEEMLLAACPRAVPCSPDVVFRVELGALKLWCMPDPALPAVHKP